VAMKIKREAGKLIRPREVEAGLWRTVSSIEPNRPFRSVWAIVGVSVLFAVVAAGGYYWSSKPQQAPGALQVVSLPDAAAKPAGTEAPAMHPALQLANGLQPLTSQQPGESTTMPISAQSPPFVPNKPPKLASRLRPINAPRPSSEIPLSVVEAVPPAEPPYAFPRPRPIRNAAPPLDARGVPPGSPSGLIKF
jgi:hypothetical protein